MAGMSIGGISSGLDTESIINQLIAVEANPQVLLKKKLSKQNTNVSALQGMNARVASLATAATALTKPEAWTKTAATSSSSSVTTSTRAASGSGSLTFDVTQVAQKASYASDPITDGSAPGATRLNLRGGDGVDHPIEAASGDARDLALAINGANAGVVATAVRVESGKYRLLVTAAETGAAKDFTLTAESGAFPLTKLSAGQDARVRVGTVADGFDLTSPSNTFTDLMDGVSITVSKPETGVTVIAAPDTAAVTKQVAGVIGALGVVFSEIADQTSTKTGDVGPLAGNSLLRGLQQQLASTISASVPGATLKDVGIDLTRDGAVTFDQAAFATFVAKEPVKSQALIKAFAASVTAVAEGASNSSTGTISQAVVNDQATAKDLTSRIADWDVRLDLRRVSLERTYASLELALNKSKSTASWLSGALSSLPSYS